MRRRSGIAGTMAGTLLLSAGITALAAGPAGATTIDPAPEHQARVSAGATSLTAHWPTTTFPLGTETLHLTLPDELLDSGIEAYSWNLTALGDHSGSVPGSVTTIDIPLPPDLPVRTPVSLLISTAADAPGSGSGGGASGDSAMLWADFSPADPVEGAPDSGFTSDDASADGSDLVFDYDLSLDDAVQSELAVSYTGDPSPALLVAGTAFALDADPGFWSSTFATDDPQSDARATAWLGADADADAAASIALDYTISDDGARLLLDLPDSLTADDVRGDDLLRVGFTRPHSPSDPPGSSQRADFRMPVGLQHAITADRVDGADRYEVAVNVSAQSFPDGAEVAYIVTGSTFPDALAAGPAAVAERGPLLLTDGQALPSSVRGELERLAPARIVLVGGPASVSAAVEEELGTIAPTERVGGADRYEVSRNLLAHAFSDGARRVYVATGEDFPDALSAGAAAGTERVPVLLLNGSDAGLDEATAESLRSLGVAAMTIVGGPASIPATLESELGAIAPTSRSDGADRYATSLSLTLSAFDESTRALLVTGAEFPDALTGSGWAGEHDLPLYAVHPDCVPAETLTALQRQGVGTVTLIGGEATLSRAVLDLTACAAG